MMDIVERIIKRLRWIPAIIGVALAVLSWLLPDISIAWRVAGTGMIFGVAGTVAAV